MSVRTAIALIDQVGRNYGAGGGGRTHMLSEERGILSPVPSRFGRDRPRRIRHLRSTKYASRRLVTLQFANKFANENSERKLGAPGEGRLRRLDSGAHCPYCEALNVFLRFSAGYDFICRECGQGVTVRTLVQ